MIQLSFKKILVNYYLPITFLVVAAILIGGLFKLILPFYRQTIAQKETEIIKYDQQLQDRLNRFKELKKLKKDYDSIELAEKEKLNFILPNKDQIPEIFLQLDAIAQETGLFLSSIDVSEVAPARTGSKPVAATDNITGSPAASPAEEASEGNVVGDSSPSSLFSQVKTLEVPIVLTGGNYDKLKMFLTKIERNLRLFAVKSVSFKDSFETIDIVLNTYYYPSK